MSTGEKLPVSEIFTSIQGEGRFAGTVMTFIRLAGCSVGQPLLAPQREALIRENPHFTDRPGQENPVVPDSLPVYTEMCQAFDGTRFLCDTDFRTKSVLTPQEILAEVPANVEHICLTGGEPLMHPLEPFMSAYWERWPRLVRPPRIHVETSGTKWNGILNIQDVWITCSPKIAWLPKVVGRANELKFLVGPSLKEEAIYKVIQAACEWPGRREIFLQAIGEEWTLKNENVRRVVELVKEHPSWRISTQLQKIWGVR